MPSQDLTVDLLFFLSTEAEFHASTLLYADTGAEHNDPYGSISTQDIL